MSAHLIEAFIWGFLYLALGIFDALEPAVYLVLVAYTTLGFGDVPVAEPWRLLGGLTAANGFLAFGWSAVFQVEYFSHLQVSRIGVDMIKRGVNPKLCSIPYSAIAPFLILAFGLAWSMMALFVVATEWVIDQFGEISGRHPLFVLAVYSPAISALVIVLFYAGTSGLKRFLSRLLFWRIPAFWWVFLLLGIPLIYFAGACVKGNALTAALFAKPLLEMLPAIGFMLILGPVEELGWRGVALPLLQRRFTPLWSGLILGMIWGVWHLPAFFLSGTPQSAWGFTPFLIGSIAVSLILTSLFNRSNGSILLAMLFHFQLNNPLWPDAQPYDTAFFVVAAAITVWLNREAMYRRGGGIVEVVPQAVRVPDP